jgi:NuA3 HAT complex component NTO1
MVQERLETRYYVSAYQFAADFCAAFANSINTPPVAPIVNRELEEFDERTWRASVVLEQKEKRKLAKRVLKAVDPLLKDAIRSEADLLKKSFEEMPELNLLEAGLPPKDPPAPSPVEASIPVQPEESTHDQTIAATEKDPAQDTEDKMDIDTETPGQESVAAFNGEEKKQVSPPSQPTPTASATSHIPESASVPQSSAPEPPTPPLSHASASSTWNVLGQGGTPWYMAAFSPEGTTIHDEKWSGRDVAREMSEELSDMGDEELDGLNPDKDLDTVTSTPKKTATLEPPPEKSKASAKKKKAKTKKRHR